MVAENLERSAAGPHSYRSVLLVVCLVLAAANLFRTPFWSADVVEYQAIYELIASGTIDSVANFVQFSFEPGFVLLAILTGYVTTSVNLLLFLFGFAALCIKLVFIQRRYIRNGAVLVLLYALTYYLLLELTQSRIALASAIILLGYHFLVTDRPGRFILAIVVATLFHYTAIFAILALFFYKQSGFDAVKRNLIVLGVLAAAAIAFKSSAIFDLILLFDAKKASYLSAADVDQGSGLVRVAFVVCYQALILVAVMPAAIKAAPAVTRFHTLLFNLYLTSLWIYLCLHPYGVVAVRLAEVFRNVEPFLLAISYSHCANRNKPLLLIVAGISIGVNLLKNSVAFFPDSE